MKLNLLEESKAVSQKIPLRIWAIFKDSETNKDAADTPKNEGNLSHQDTKSPC